MLKGFKDFLLRGNVLDLAVAVVVGAAFTAIVTAFTSNIINPLIAAIGGSDELGWGKEIIAGNSETFVNIAPWSPRSSTSSSSQRSSTSC